MNGDAAEEVVRMALNTADISIRLVGAGAKNLAALLVAWAKKEKKHIGKTSLPKLLSSGDELHVLSLTEKQYDGFKKLAKKKITYAPFLNTKTKDGKVDIVLGAKQLSFANHILTKVGYRNIEPGTGAHVEILNEKDKEAIGEMSFENTSGTSKKTILHREPTQETPGRPLKAGAPALRAAVSLPLKSSLRRTNACLKSRGRRNVHARRAGRKQRPRAPERTDKHEAFRQISGVGILP